MDKKNTNLDELLKVIAASGAGIPIAGIRVLVKKADEDDEPVGKEPVSHEAVDKEPVNHQPVGKMDTPAAESMDEPAELAKKQPISICIENLHIHMDERMTTNYGPGALAGVSDEDCEEDCEADEEACDCGHGKSCDHCSNKSCAHKDHCAHSDDDDAGIDFDQMVRFIRRRTGMCERTVLAFLAAQIEYLDSVIDEEDEA